MFKPGNSSSPAEAPNGLLITGGTGGAQKIAWDSGNNRFDITSNIKSAGTVYADGGIDVISGTLNIGASNATGVTITPAVTLSDWPRPESRFSRSRRERGIYFE